MRPDREQALKLRLSGKSYLEINRILGIPKGTLSGWFSQLELSSTAKQKILQTAKKKNIDILLAINKAQTANAIKRMREDRNRGASEILELSKDNLLILGAALYWAEGYKRPIHRNGRERTFHKVSMTNSDPFLARAFIRFLREVCAVPLDRIKANLRIYQHLNEHEMKRFWQKQTGIPEKNFQKTYYGISKSSLRKRPYNRLPYGVIQIVVADTRLFHRIMGYIEKIKRFM